MSSSLEMNDWHWHDKARVSLHALLLRCVHCSVIVIIMIIKERGDCSHVARTFAESIPTTQEEKEENDKVHKPDKIHSHSLPAFSRSSDSWLLFSCLHSRAIEGNQDLRWSSPLSSLFQNDFWGTPLTHSGSHKSYRPLTVLSFRVNFWFHGLQAWGYHFVNVLLHALVTLLFTRLSGHVFHGEKRPALISSLVFAVHPIHTEAVTSVVGRADVLAGLFFLLSFMSYLSYVKNLHNNRLNLWSCLIFASLSMLSKETGISKYFCLSCSMSFSVLMTNTLTLIFLLFLLQILDLLANGVAVLAVCGIYHLFIHHRVLPTSREDFRSLLQEVLYSLVQQLAFINNIN